MNNTQYIKEFGGKIIGKITTKPNGDKEACTFTGKILGKYKKAQDITTDFYGAIVARGDATASLIYAEEAKEKSKKGR